MSDPFFELTKPEMMLIQEYGYPEDHVCEQINVALKQESDSGYHPISMTDTDLHLLIGDLIHHAKSIRSHKLLDQLDELITTLECGL